jgi:urea carboxylase
MQRLQPDAGGSADLGELMDVPRHARILDVCGEAVIDCSAQKDGRVFLSEAPASDVPDAVRGQLLDSAPGRFLYDPETGDLHPLGSTTVGPVPTPSGCTLRANVYAESLGHIMDARWCRPTCPSRMACTVETRIERGTEITAGTDPHLATITVNAPDRHTALRDLRAALAECSIEGVATNLDYLREIARHPAVTLGRVTTGLLPRFVHRRRAIQVLAPGIQTTVQDYPGRIGYWHVGVPPSGPMDALAFRMANRLAGNHSGAAALEITVNGPTLRFECDTTIALTGADFGAILDAEPMPLWQAVPVRAGSMLRLAAVRGAGYRAYLAVAGGFETPQYLGSRSTFILGKFGGHAGRVLRAGDVLRIGGTHESPRALPGQLAPRYGNEWEIGVLYGPHGAPDFFAPEDVEMFFATPWKVHHNSDRTGVRLIGPKPKWARPDGGEAGLHPSNIHDNAYAIGTVDFTGDMPVILGADGPSLGGFVCLATIAHAELWKMGQLRPGDLVRFRAISHEQASRLDRALEGFVDTLEGPLPALPPATPEDPVLRRAPGLAIREDGDRYLLIEYGPNVLDLNLRFRVQALEQELRRAELPGILDVTPGVRSLHIHYDGRRLTRGALLEALADWERHIPDMDDVAVPSRVVHLPLSWDDPATQLAIRKYTQSVRPDAPWAPSNIEFIRRINGLGSIDDVRRIVFSADYLVLGLGDVYLGAPVATPVDPRHRLVTTKYNPARTWTPENAVGIGGAYLCVYGMEGPGGYQFVGRTVQMWNTWRSTAEFEPGTPWLLRFFDRIRFYPVSAEELLEIREAFPHGRYPLRIEQGEFRLRDYHAFLQSIEAEAAACKRRQQAAFEEERERWARAAKSAEVAV